MSRILQQIQTRHICKPLSLPAPYSKPYSELLITRDAFKIISDKQTREIRWLIGPHPALSDLATRLREDETLCDLLAEEKVGLGFRESDQPPQSLQRKESYGKNKPGDRDVRYDHTRERKHEILPAVRQEQSAPEMRISDQWKNKWQYWQSQTPQAHHIVEFNNLAALGLSKERGAGDLDYARLPCVLLMAEFHQRYISSYLKPTHRWTGKKREVFERLKQLYRTIYQTPGAALTPLWKVSKIIFDAAEPGLK